jgi:lysophospholipase L1-like esterase
MKAARRAVSRGSGSQSGARPPERDRKLGVGARLGLLAFGLFAGFLLCEAVVRWCGLGPATNVVLHDNFQLSNDPILRYELVPGSVDGPFRISAAGLRDHEYTVDKPADVFRILVLGDSIAYGFGVTQPDPLSEQLEDLLKLRQVPGIARFEVLNLGVVGYNIAQVAEMLRVRGARYRPDLILYAYCLNDPQDYSFELAALEAKLSPALRSYRARALRAGRSLLEASRFVSLLRYALARSFETQHGEAAPRDLEWATLTPDAYAEHFAQLYRDPAAQARLAQGVRDLKQLALELHAPLVSLIFPVFLELDAYRLSAEHRQVAASFAAAGLPSYDLLQLYAAMQRKHGQLAVLNALHPNALGHRLAALYVLQRLTQDRFLPRGQAADRRSDLARLDGVLDDVIAGLKPTAAEDAAPRP